MKRLNSIDIAKLAGVSRSTVSRVINNYPNVPEETRRRVMKVIKENHYYPQISGQLLNGNTKTRTIGLFWLSRSSIALDPLSSSYFMNIVDAATENGYMVLSSTLGDLKDKKNIQFVRKVFMEGRIDAGIFVGASNNDPLLCELLEMGMIIGAFDFQTLEESGPNCVTVNFERNSGEKAVDLLVEMGHKKIALIEGDMNRMSCQDRHDSFLRGMSRHGLPIRNEWLVYGGITRVGGYDAAKRLLTECGEDRPTAIFANNDSAAFGVYQACEELGIRIPEDISVMGVDGHVNAKHVNPPLTTVEFDFRSMFSSLVTRVIAAVEEKGEYEKDAFFDGNLVIRNSCKKI